MKPIIERLLNKCIPEPNSGCWLWLGYVIEDGYGRIRGEDGKLKLSHRESYRVHNGEFDESLQVLHHCDTPACINPDHLFVGSVTDNMRDMQKKGRGKAPNRGVTHHLAKLNPEKAFEIRWQNALGMSWRLLALEYGMAKYAIQCIIKGRSWRPEVHD